MPNKKSRKKKTAKDKFLKQVRRFSARQLLAFVVIFAGVGGYAIYSSFALADVSHIGGSYRNPLRGVTNINASRIDQGVDYSGTGPVYALGDGVVETSTNSAGWPTGHFIAYKLTNGPAAGLYVYVAEHCQNLIPNGTHVTSSTRICTMYNGCTSNGECGMEIGWSAQRSNYSVAAGYANYGKNFSKLMAAFGSKYQGTYNGFSLGPVPPNPPYHSWVY